MSLDRYLLFKGEHYYPNGGWHDFVFHAKSILSLTNFIAEQKEKGLWDEYDWWHIYDTEKCEIILKSEFQPKQY